MTDRVYSEFSAILSKIKPGIQDNFAILGDIIVLLITHREYLYYLISTRTKICVDDFLLKLKAKDISLFDNVYSSDGSVTDMEAYKKNVFIAGNILYFQIVRNKIYDTLKLQDTFTAISEYSSKICSFLKKGLGEDVSEVTAFRLATLDSFCNKNMEGLKPVNKVFVSVCSIVKEKGFKGVTVESVAKGIGLAKSSIYSKFDNKAQMICSLIHEEFDEMFEILKKNITEARSNAERAYVIMETELLYFMKKPELFTVGQWLQLQHTEDVMHDEAVHEKIFSEILDRIELYENYPDLGLPCEDRRIISSWFMMIPIFVYMHTEKQNMAPEIVHAMLKDIFMMMEKGV